MEAAAIDMSAVYAAAVQARLTRAEIVHDRIHVSELLGEFVYRVRAAKPETCWLRATVGCSEHATYGFGIPMN